MASKYRARKRYRFAKDQIAAHQNYETKKAALADQKANEIQVKIVSRRKKWWGWQEEERQQALATGPDHGTAPSPSDHIQLLQQLFRSIDEELAAFPSFHRRARSESEVISSDSISPSAEDGDGAQSRDNQVSAGSIAHTRSNSLSVEVIRSKPSLLLDKGVSVSIRRGSITRRPQGLGEAGLKVTKAVRRAWKKASTIPFMQPEEMLVAAALMDAGVAMSVTPPPPPPAALHHAVSTSDPPLQLSSVPEYGQVEEEKGSEDVADTAKPPAALTLPASSDVTVGGKSHFLSLQSRQALRSMWGSTGSEHPNSAVQEVVHALQTQFFLPGPDVLLCIPPIASPDRLTSLMNDIDDWLLMAWSPVQSTAESEQSSELQRSSLDLELFYPQSQPSLDRFLKWRGSPRFGWGGKLPSLYLSQEGTPTPAVTVPSPAVVVEDLETLCHSAVNELD